MEAQPTLDQIQIFMAVAESGGFSAAARRLKRSQSVISYAIANLEAQLNVSLFDRAGTRQPQLTEAGVALLADARRIVAGLEGMRARAIGLRQGLEAELTLAVDVVVPTDALARALCAFGQTFPTVGLRLHVGALGVVYDTVMRRQADLGIGGEPARFDDRIVAEAIGTTTMVPVAAPGHPLALASTPVPLSIVRDQVQLVITDLTDQTKGKDFGVLSFRTWRLTDTNVKHALIRAGLGWGGLPLYLVRDDLAAGRLVRLALESYPQRAFPLFSLRHAASAPGPAATWMVGRFRQELAVPEAS
jgi:DNA-binding transcriptional LysR family regulator